MTLGSGNSYKTNIKVPKDDSITAKIKEAKEKLQAEISQQKDHLNSLQNSFS